VRNPFQCLIRTERGRSQTPEFIRDVMYLCRPDHEARDPQRDDHQWRDRDEPVERQCCRVKKDIVGACGDDGPVRVAEQL